MIPVQFNYTAPESLKAAVTLLKENKGAKILAGGHSLIEAMKQGYVSPSLLIDLLKIDYLQGIKFSHKTDGILRIGAMTTYAQIASNFKIKENYHALAEAVNSIGDAQIRNWGRLGDIFAYYNLARDLPAVFLALGATLKTVGTSGTKVLTSDEFISLYLQKQSELNEFIATIYFPSLVRGTGSAYESVRHPASNHVICGIAVLVEPSANKTIGKCRVAVTGATSYAVRLSQVEAALEGKAPTAENFVEATELATNNIITLEQANKELAILSDSYASAEYRTHLIGTLTKRAFQHAAKKAIFNI